MVNLKRVRKILAEAKSDNIAPVKMLKKRSKTVLSARLQKLYDRLKRGPGTTSQIAFCTRSQAVHSDIADLRKAGVKVNKAKYIKTTREGRRVFEYSL